MESGIIKSRPPEGREIGELSIHPALKDIPRLADDDEKMIAMRAGMERTGNVRTIYIDEQNRIIDGRHWYWCARKLGWTHLTCQVFSEEKVNDIIIHTMLNRRHLTPGQRAYLLAPRIQEAFLESRARQLNALKKGEELPVANSVRNGAVMTLEAYAADIGCSVRYLQQAKEIHDLFAAHPDKRTLTGENDKPIKNTTFKQVFEPRILREEDPIGLGGALAGIKSILDADKHPLKKTGGQPKELEKQFRLFNKVAVDEINRWKFWGKFSDDQKAEHYRTVLVKASKLDAAQCNHLAEHHAKLAAQFRKAAKDGEEAVK